MHGEVMWGESPAKLALIAFELTNQISLKRFIFIAFAISRLHKITNWTPEKRNQVQVLLSLSLWHMASLHTHVAEGEGLAC